MAPIKIVLLACGSFNPPTFQHFRMFELARDNLNRLNQYQVIGGIISPVHDNYGKNDLVSSTHRCALIKLALQDSDWIYLSDWESRQEDWTPTRQVLQYHQNKINAAIKAVDTIDHKLNDSLGEPVWLANVAKNCNNKDRVVVRLLCGADMLQSFGTPGLWKESDIETIVGDHGLAVITRSGSEPYKFIYESDILSKLQPDDGVNFSTDKENNIVTKPLYFIVFRDSISHCQDTLKSNSITNNIIIINEWISNEVSSTRIRRALKRGESVKYLISNPVIDYIRSQNLYGCYDNKYLFINSSAYDLTPSPSDLTMNPIDVRDSGNYARYSPSVQESQKLKAPGQAIPIREVTEEEDDETRVEIQITEDGRIQVISDKETTV